MQVHLLALVATLLHTAIMAQCALPHSCTHSRWPPSAQQNTSQR